MGKVIRGTLAVFLILVLFLSCTKPGNKAIDQDGSNDESDPVSEDSSAWERMELKRADTSFVYKLPYTPGTSWKVTQSYFIWGTHEGIYAIDWVMDEDTPICAVRDGEVIDVVDGNQWHDSDLGSTETLASNWVVIRHEDGSFACYNHISYGSAKVAVGQYVKAGDVIGLCDRVGAFSGAFHLHFEVYRMTDGLKETYPVLFWSGKEQPYEIFLGAIYYAPRFDGDEPEATKGETALSDMRNVLYQVGSKGQTLREGRILIRDFLLKHKKKYNAIWKKLMARVMDYDAQAAIETDLIIGQNDLLEHVGLSKILDAQQPDEIANQIELIWAEILQN